MKKLCSLSLFFVAFSLISITEVLGVCEVEPQEMSAWKRFYRKSENKTGKVTEAERKRCDDEKPNYKKKCDEVGRELCPLALARADKKCVYEYHTFTCHISSELQWIHPDDPNQDLYLMTTTLMCHPKCKEVDADKKPSRLHSDSVPAPPQETEENQPLQQKNSKNKSVGADKADQ